MFDQLAKLKELQQKMEETKKRLDSITVSANALSGKILVECSANKRIKSIKIDPAYLHTASVTEIEKHLLAAINEALENAEKVNEAEMRSIAGGMLGKIPGFS